jgi:membrane protein insertase Oxa1/YidC/SpoIIIJ
LQGDFFLTQWAFLGMRWLYESLTAENIVLTIIISTLFIRALTYSATSAPEIFHEDAGDPAAAGQTP